MAACVLGVYSSSSKSISMEWVNRYALARLPLSILFFLANFALNYLLIKNGESTSWIGADELYQ